MSVRQAGAVKFIVNIDGEVPTEHLVSVVIDRDVNQADMAVIVLSNEDHRYSKKGMSKRVEIKVGDDNKVIYIGEVVGLEPVYRGGEKSRITIRAMNKLHRLLRGRKSITYAKMSDQEILSKVVGGAGLALEWKHEKSIKYDHVYQHNQTNLEFLRTRAARMGCHVWCWDSTVYCKQIDLQQPPSVEVKTQEGVGTEGHQLRSFSPRVSGATVVKKMTVKGWNPETKQLITGECAAQPSRLGAHNAVAAAGDHGNEESFTCDHPIWSKEEADAIAKAKLVDANLMYITGEAETIGDSAFDIAKVIKVTVNPEQADDAFNGRYYVMGLTHRYTPGGGDKGGGFVTSLRVARDAQGGL